MFTQVSFEIASKVFRGLAADYGLSDNDIVCCVTDRHNQSIYCSEIRAAGVVIWSY